MDDLGHHRDLDGRMNFGSQGRQLSMISTVTTLYRALLRFVHGVLVRRHCRVRR
jgi:hypothetical protein